MIVDKTAVTYRAQSPKCTGWQPAIMKLPHLFPSSLFCCTDTLWFFPCTAFDPSPKHAIIIFAWPLKSLQSSHNTNDSPGAQQGLTCILSTSSMNVADWYSEQLDCRVLGSWTGGGTHPALGDPSGLCL